GLQASHLDRKVPENVIVSDGSLAIRVEKRGGHHNNDSSRPWRDYASGIAQSYGKWTQAYGYMEARIKLPVTRGLWPAFWTMPDRGAASGLDIWARRDTGTRQGKGMEIDIMEHLCEWGPGRHNAAIHWDGYGPEHKAW